MLDFMMVATKATKNGLEIYPKLIIKKSDDLMIRGSDFRAVWLSDLGRWSTDEQDAIRLVDTALDEYHHEHQKDFEGRVRVLHLWDAETGMIDNWHRYCQRQMRDNWHPLDETLVFANSPVRKDDYSSKRLDYPLESGSHDAWDKLMGVLYSPEELHKLEWAIGSIVTGDSKWIQKFIVLYGSAGTGKSTFLNIVQDLFKGYCAVFDAKSLVTNNAFAMEQFKSGPLVAIQHDGDLSKIEDNTRLNSLVSHETMTVNEKFKGLYSNSFKAFLFMGTNRPVKITDSKSGLLRRLIDVSPSGNKVDPKEYKRLMKDISYELGAIAYHCMEVYKADPGFYDNYIPLSMMGASNNFYNFVLDHYSYFRTEDIVTLKYAYDLYKRYCEETNSIAMSRMIFKEEFKNYFKEYSDRSTDKDGTRVRSVYTGFLHEKIDGLDAEPKVDSEIRESGWIHFENIASGFDVECRDCLAQYTTTNGTPSNRWSDVLTKLRDIDTSQLHYVKVPESHIVIDFDIRDGDEKSIEKNLKEANKWPPTYAELSKSGAGIHLHYIYKGDVTQLARLYDKNVEIKVFTGNSSLRRKLTKCTKNPIAVLTSGLPIKEKKMITKTQLNDWRHLKNCIEKAMRKEVWPNTKPNIDYIKSILDEAYASGMTYNLEAMHEAVLYFAMGSSNNKDYCVRTVAKMHFSSDDTSENKEIGNTPIAFYDIEVFPNLLLVNWKLQGKGNPVVRMINPSAEEIEELVKYRLIGFNCRRYDNHLLYARMMGYSNNQIYLASQKIINNDKNAMFGEAYNLSYTDVYDFASSGNKKSLKKLEIEMSHLSKEKLSKDGYSEDEIELILKGTHHQELGLPWDEPVPEELWPKVAEYCDNDVYATEAAFLYLKADWTARQILADLAEMTVNDTTNSLTTKIIFGKNRKPQSEFCYRNLAEPVTELAKEVLLFLKETCPKMMEKKHTSAGLEAPFEMEGDSLLPYFYGYEFKNGVSTYRGFEVGEGGMVYAEPGMYGNVALLDVSSMHPHSTIAECLFGPVFTRAYLEIVEGRVSIKHEAWDIVNGYLDGRLTPFIQRVKDGKMTSGDLANALKTAINSVYGLTAARFSNPFKDPRNIDNIVAKRGALFMIDLMYEVKKRGFTVAHIKTDSIKIPDATPEIIQFVKDFGLRYGYTFEHEATYDRMCLVNDAVYIAKYATMEQCEKLYSDAYLSDKENCSKNRKKGGHWDATGKEFAIPYTFKSLFSGEPIEFQDLCETFAVSKGELYLDMNENLPDVSSMENELSKLEDKFKKGKINDMTFQKECERLIPEIEAGHAYKFVGRVGQFCPVKKNGGCLYRKADGKYYAAPGSTGYRWLESDVVSNINDVDISFYENLAEESKKKISEYGDFYWFISEDLYISPQYVNGVPVYLSQKKEK